MKKRDEKMAKGNEAYDSAKKAEKQKEFMAACTYYTQAAGLFRDIGEKEKFEECKKQIVEMNKLSMKYEFKEFSQKTDIGEEQAQKIEKDNSNIANLPLTKALEFISFSPNFCPKIADVIESANKTIPLTFQLFSVYAVDENGNTLRGSHDAKKQWLMKMYGIRLQLSIQLYLYPIFKELLKKRLFIGRKLTCKKLYSYINRNNIISEDKQKIIKNGIKSFFDKNYISAMHILVPQFESLFLSVCNKIGINTIKINRGKQISTETITFSEQHLDNEIFQSKWGRDYCELINFILFRPLGYKIRHNIAHGLIKDNECSLIPCLLIIYLFISLSARVRSNPA